MVDLPNTIVDLSAQCTALHCTVAGTSMFEEAVRRFPLVEEFWISYSEASDSPVDVLMTVSFCCNMAPMFTMLLSFLLTMLGFITMLQCNGAAPFLLTTS